MEKFIEEKVKNNLESILEKIARGIKNKVKDIWEKFKTDYQLVFMDYLKGAYDKYSKVKTLIYRTEPQQLAGSKGFFEKPYLKKGTDSFVVDSINTLLSRNTNCIIIEGTGGVGKSTLMKYLFLSVLEEKEFVPIFVELREINHIDETYDLSDLFFRKLDNLGSTLNPEYMDRSLCSGVYVFLLDGYDEIITEKRDSFITKLDEFIDRYPENYYILSSRPFSSFVELQRFSVFRVCPFTKDQAISQVKKLKYEKGTKEKLIKALSNGLYEKHKSFASNPLLLSIMLLTYENFADFPSKIHNFYSEAFNTMLQKHDASKSGFKRELKWINAKVCGVRL